MLFLSNDDYEFYKNSIDYDKHSIIILNDPIILNSIEIFKLLNGSKLIFKKIDSCKKTHCVSFETSVIIICKLLDHTIIPIIEWVNNQLFSNTSNKKNCISRKSICTSFTKLSPKEINYIAVTHDIENIYYTNNKPKYFFTGIHNINHVTISDVITLTLRDFLDNYIFQNLSIVEHVTPSKIFVIVPSRRDIIGIYAFLKKVFFGFRIFRYIQRIIITDVSKYGLSEARDSISESPMPFFFSPNHSMILAQKQKEFPYFDMYIYISWEESYGSIVCHATILSDKERSFTSIVGKLDDDLAQKIRLRNYLAKKRIIKTQLGDPISKLSGMPRWVFMYKILCDCLKI